MRGFDTARVRHLSLRAREVYASEGIEGVLRRGRLRLRRQRGFRRDAGLPATPVGASAVKWPVSVLSVAEQSIPQCYHYRVEQKAQILSGLGVPFESIGIDDLDHARSRLQLAGLLIVYRLAWTPALHALVEEAHRLRIPVVFEVDDLVHDREATAANPNLQTLPTSLRDAVIAGADGYGRALAAAEVNLASTQVLADDMQSLNRQPGMVVANGIDDSMLAAEPHLRAVPKADTPIVIYGSGSRAHDHDFAVAAPGIAQWLHENPDARLHLVGPVQVPAVLQPLAAQIQRTAQELPYEEYLRHLRRSTICIAPLVDAHFNTFKSHVKYLEAALVGTALVASPTVYADYVRDGQTGLIADADGWERALSRLTQDPDLPARLTAAARDDVRRWELRNEPTEQMRAVLDAVAPSWRGR